MRLHDRLALGFFVGAAVLTMSMLVLGYLSLYWRVMAWAIAVPIIATSYRHFALAVSEAKVIDCATFAGRFSDRPGLVDRDGHRGGFRRRGTPAREGALPAGRSRLLPALLAFLCGSDRHHGIWPNLFWYEYYFSKGMGVTFLGMLLTDALAPSLVAYCFAVATALALYALVRDFCSHTLWPWLAVVLYLALNVHTLGTGAYSATAAGATFRSRTR